MSIFKKAAEEEMDFDEDEVEDEERGGALRRKKIRDLKPENRKKRKELPKPWTKKERYLIIYTLVGTFLLSVALFASARGWKLPGLPKIKLPALADKTIVITAQKGDSQRSEKIISQFKEKTNPLSGIYAFYYIRLSDGFSYGVNKDEEMQAASLIKLPVFATLYQETEAGRINLDEKYVLKDSDKLGGSGSLYGKPAGTILTYRQMAAYMGKESDNTAFNILRKRFGDTKIMQVAKAIGMTKTSLADNTTTPTDIGIFFQKLWDGKIVTQKSRDEILSYMTDTIYENWLVKGIPDVKIAHKYGRETHIVNDAGIIEDNTPFVLVIMTKGIIEKEADAIFPNLANLIYEGQKN